MTGAETVRWYYKTRDAIGAPALDFVDSSGRLYDKSCRHCGFLVRHYRQSWKDYVCGRCGENWHFEDHHIFKGEVQTSPKRDGWENRNLFWTQVGTVLHGMLSHKAWKWDMRIYVATCVGCTIGDLETVFVANYPEAPGPWGRSSIFTRIKRAKDEWERRLKVAGVEVE